MTYGRFDMKAIERAKRNEAFAEELLDEIIGGEGDRTCGMDELAEMFRSFKRFYLHAAERRDGVVVVLA